MPPADTTGGASSCGIVSGTARRGTGFQVCAAGDTYWAARSPCQSPAGIASLRRCGLGDSCLLVSICPACDLRILRYSPPEKISSTDMASDRQIEIEQHEPAVYNGRLVTVSADK